jgi:hypothetical protein
MKKFLILILLLSPIYLKCQVSISRGSNSYDLKKLTEKPEPMNIWALNLLFSDNGFGVGATYYKNFTQNLSGIASIFFSSAKDDREFETSDIFGNSYTPYKVNRLYMIPVNLGIQIRLFKDDVSDNLRPYLNTGLTPTTIIYTPYNESLISSFGHAKARFAFGAFAGAGLDYLTSKKSSLSLNIRFYYISLFGNGIESLEGKEKTFYGGLYFVFSYNFMK